jgi:ribosomal protein S18 acetylase RimI-like enzyme
MTMTTTTRPVAVVTRLGADALPAAAALFARAFDEEPLNRVLFPEAEERRRTYDALVRMLLGRALPYGHVFGAWDDGSLLGVAVWAPPNVRLSVRPTLDSLPTAAQALASYAQALPRALPLLLRSPRGARRYVATRRRALRAVKATPKWHLAGLATDPPHQGRGVARALLEHVLVRADADGASVWLETNDPGNVGLYERFGFTVTAHVEADGQLPDWWVMVREPHALI